MKSSPFAQHATHLLHGGYSPVPLRVGTKRPLFDNWDRLRAAALTHSEIVDLVRQQPRLGLGVAGGFNCLVPIDIDTNDKEITEAIFSAIPEPLVAKKGQDGLTAFYWDPTGMIEAVKFKRPLGGGKFEMLVEILTTGQSVLPPTIHPDTKQPYRWLTEATLFNTPVDCLPEITPKNTQALRSVLTRWMPEQKRYEPKPLAHSSQPPSDKRQAAYARAILFAEVRDLKGMQANSGRNRRLFEAGCKLGKYVHHKVLGYSEIENELLGACQLNGLISEDGIKACKATLISGVKRAANDQLPSLENRPRRAA